MTDILDQSVPSTAAAGERCFHCGEPCPPPALLENGKAFCCSGCLLVHDLLLENGLGQFYDLNAHPGVRIGNRETKQRWAYLDEPELQKRLLDFTDGRLSRVTFHVPSIHCVSCVWLLENLFRLRPGIGRSQVNFTRRTAVVDFDPGRIRLSEVVELLASLGYEPRLTLAGLDAPREPSVAWGQWTRIGVAGFAFGNIMLFSLPTYFGLDSVSRPMLLKVFGHASLLLALPVLLYSASDYWKTAWYSVRRRSLTLDVPIALGLAALYGQSVMEVLAGRGVGYLDSLVGLVFFLLCGKAFQHMTHERLAFDHDYRAFFPLAVTRVTSAGPEATAISELQVGDRIRLRHGELIPADATLVEGSAIIDYSFVTGESASVRKEAGDHLYAGGRQTGGTMDAEIVKPVSQSYLTSLWDHDAFRKKSGRDFQTLTARYGRYFIRLVLAIAIGAALYWAVTQNAGRGLKVFASVLIVACPCALALAAPFTLGTAQRILARRGIYLRNATVVEELGQVDAIVFDKTGTLTRPGARRAAFQGEPLSAVEQVQILSLAQHSTHPHARRIQDELAGDSSTEKVEHFGETPGSGLEGWVRGERVVLGSKKWLEQQGVRCDADLDVPSCSAEVPNREKVQSAGQHGWVSNELESNVEDTPTLFCPGASTVHVGIGGRYRGAFLLAQDLRADTGRLLAGLDGRYRVALLSGDNDSERSRFEQLFGGRATLHFNQSPLEKLEFIRKLQDGGQTVMMVGDGLNDAGALRQSNVGVAVMENAGTFTPASDVIVEGTRVPDMAALLAYARRASRLVRVGLGISAVYNVIGVSFAAAGLLSPIFCAILMPLSSASVVIFACVATRLAARGLGIEREAPARARSADISASLQPAF